MPPPALDAPAGPWSGSAWPTWLGAGGVALALAAYLFGLDAPTIPSIGDEPLYLQIARVTGASGRLLPLTAEAGILDTKPPLLFWTGVAATRAGAAWALWRLRLPVVLLTFAAAGLVGWLAARLARDRAAGFLGALLFLGFRATQQHGRPFLTNAYETLFLLLPLVLVMRARPGPDDTGAPPAGGARGSPAEGAARAALGGDLALGAACGLAFGLAALAKSFFLVVPGTTALALFLWRRDGRAALWGRHARWLGLAAALGLALFALWPLLDPRPDLILSQFVVRENAGKLEPGRFLIGLYSGTWPLWRIWLGPLLNAGLLAPPLLGLGLDTWLRRRALPAEEAALWWWVLGFLLVYSIPTQRQENYLLPAGAALAALLAARWHALGRRWIQAPLLVLGLAALLLPLALWGAGEAFLAGVAEPTGAMAGTPAGPLFPAWLSAAALALGAAALAGALRPRLGRRLLPLLAVLALPLVTGVLTPFNRPLPPGAAAVAGVEVEAPDRFSQDQELLRFRLPGAALRRYQCPRGAVPCPPPPPEGRPALAYLDLGAPAPPGWALCTETPALKMRHSPEQLARLLGGDLGQVLERLVLLRPEAPVQVPGRP